MKDKAADLPVRRRRKRWLVGLALASVIIASTIVAEILVGQSYSSGCSGGLGPLSSCGTEAGFDSSQTGTGQFVNGSYVYSILVSPVPPPTLEAASLAVRAFNLSANGSTEVPMNLSNVTLFSIPGSVIAVYHAYGSIWYTGAPLTIVNASVLRVESPKSLVDQELAVYDSVTKLTHWMRLQ
jgi:hypothetical protein